MAIVIITVAVTFILSATLIITVMIVVKILIKRHRSTSQQLTSSSALSGQDITATAARVNLQDNPAYHVKEQNRLSDSSDHYYY